MTVWVLLIEKAAQELVEWRIGRAGGCPLFRLFRQRMPFAVAATLSSVLFAATHGLNVFVPIFVVGFGLAALYEWRGSLWTNAIAHATFNTITATLIYLVATNRLPG